MVFTLHKWPNIKNGLGYGITTYLQWHTDYKIIIKGSNSDGNCEKEKDKPKLMIIGWFYIIIII